MNLTMQNNLNLGLEASFEVESIRRSLRAATIEQAIDFACDMLRLRLGEKAFLRQALKDERPLLEEAIAAKEKLESQIAGYVSQVEYLSNFVDDRVQQLERDLLASRAEVEELKTAKMVMAKDLIAMQRQHSMVLGECDRVWGFLVQAKKEIGNEQEVLRLLVAAIEKLPQRQNR